MKTFLTIYIVGAIIWFVWSKSQGYATTLTNAAIWPITLFRQLTAVNSVAQ